MAKRRGWKALTEEAFSSDRNSRQGAITRAYAWIEQALAASGLTGKRDGSIGRRLLVARGRGMLKKTIKESDIRDAISARNNLAHDISIPPPERSLAVTKTLSDVWTNLQKAYVTIERAKSIASNILEIDGISRVFLFGSLARSASNPGDIDLLIFDDGRYSSKIEETDLLYEDTMRLTLECISLLNIRDGSLKPAAKCRWIDMLILDGSQFESDLGYRQFVSGCQIDSNFFLNISNDITEYSSSSNSFIETDVLIFKKLKRIVHSLEILGFSPRSIRHKD